MIRQESLSLFLYFFISLSPTFCPPPPLHHVTAGWFMANSHKKSWINTKNLKKPKWMFKSHQFRLLLSDYRTLHLIVPFSWCHLELNLNPRNNLDGVERIFRICKSPKEFIKTLLKSASCLGRIIGSAAGNAAKSSPIISTTFQDFQTNLRGSEAFPEILRV